MGDMMCHFRTFMHLMRWNAHSGSWWWINEERHDALMFTSWCFLVMSDSLMGPILYLLSGAIVLFITAAAQTADVQIFVCSVYFQQLLLFLAFLWARGFQFCLPFLLTAPCIFLPQKHFTQCLHTDVEHLTGIYCHAGVHVFPFEPQQYHYH